MRKLVLAIIIIGFIFSCKKEKEVGDICFSTSFARINDTVSYDSVSYIIVNYSKSSELKDSSSFNDPNKYSYSTKFDVDKSQKLNHLFTTKFIHLDEGQYVIKRFDLIDKSGKIIYCIPYKVPEYYKSNIINTVSSLPIFFSTSETNTTFVFTIIKNN